MHVDQSRLLRKQIQLGYWPGFIVGMYPSQFAYEPLEVDFSSWVDVAETNLYFHMPFCQWHCNFCTFFKVVSFDDELFDRYVDRVCAQIRFYSDKFKSSVMIRSICFGGGTPNAIPAHHYARIFETLRDSNFSWDPDLEPSMEISPETITEDYVRQVRDAGVRRLSLGVQSLRDDLRKSVRRVRRLAIYDTIEMLKALGLNINIDLINGIKGQDGEAFMETAVKTAEELRPETISVYLLSGENTSLFKNHADLMTTAEKYELFDQYHAYFTGHGYRCESHVKFQREDTGSTHQQKIYEYRGTPTLGIGCGARSYNDAVHYSLPWINERLQATALIDGYLNVPFEDLPWTGFRMNHEENMRRACVYAFFAEHLDAESFRTRFGVSHLDAFPSEFAALVDNDLVTITDDTSVYLTYKGRRHTDLVGTLFWSDQMHRKFRRQRADVPARPRVRGRSLDIVSS